VALSHPNRREISLKVVYYGPGLAGKATSLGYLHNALRADARGQMISVVTGGDRTMFFDFYPPPSPRLQGNALRVQLYTTPGDVRSESTHRGLLEGVDAVVFVADSQRSRAQENVESMERLRQGLSDQGLSLGQLPHVLAWNKRDMEDVVPIDDLSMLLNRHQAPTFETVATAGRGVFDTLKAVTGLLVTDLTRRRGRHAGTASNGTGRRPSDPGLQQERSGEVRTRIPEAIELGLLSQPTYLKPREGDIVQVVASPPGSRQRQPSPAPAAPVPATPTMETQPVPLASEETQQKRRASPTWLQPLAPENVSVEVASSSATRPLWLSQITPSGPLRDQLHDMELDLATGHYAQAVRRATVIFHNLTHIAASMEAEEGQAWRALSLGIPADRYRRFREAVRNAEVGTATMEDGLFTLFFLLDASLRR
jgi:signal recognition particle receptor subunit beta